MTIDGKNKSKLNNKDDYDPWGKKCAKSIPDEGLMKGPKNKLEDIRILSSISLEFVKGFRKFANIGPCVTFFGSARFQKNHPYYKLAYETSKLIAKENYAIMTGGGPGIMEAANKGAYELQKKSLACNISLPMEQKPNDYLDSFVEFDHFFIRKMMLLRYSLAFVVLPGGFGTLDEVFETITLIQTKKIKNFPIVMMGQDFWKPMQDFILNTLLKNKTICEKDLRLLYFTDDPADALACIQSCA